MFLLDICTHLNAVSQRGVVFFRAQDSLDDTLQKELAQRLGELSGKPSSSTLHIHPIINSGREHGGSDNEISVISSVQAKALYKGSFLDPSEKKQSGKEGWHSDITFEPVPSDYAILRLVELPGTGGGKNLMHWIFSVPIANGTRLKIHSGRLVTNSLTASRPPIRNSSSP